MISQQEHIKAPINLRPVKKAQMRLSDMPTRRSENEHENVGIEAAHRTELVAEGGLRLEPPPENRTLPQGVPAAEKDGENPRKAAYQQALHDNPQLRSNVFSRMWQKYRLKGICQSCPDRPAHRAGCRENCCCHEKPVALLDVLPAATRPSA